MFLDPRTDRESLVDERVRVDGQVSDWFSISAGVRQGCAVAPDLFLKPIDWITSRSVHRGYVGVSLGQEVFTDQDLLTTSLVWLKCWRFSFWPWRS